MKYEIITEQIVECAKRVHHSLGTGFSEEIYHNALAYELELSEIRHAREVSMPIYYKELEVGKRRIDFLVKNLVSVELKTVDHLNTYHIHQAENYLMAYNIKVGLLINFGSEDFTYKILLNGNFSIDSKKKVSQKLDPAD